MQREVSAFTHQKGAFIGRLRRVQPGRLVAAANLLSYRSWMYIFGCFCVCVCVLVAGCCCEFVFRQAKCPFYQLQYVAAAPYVLLCQ